MSTKKVIMIAGNAATGKTESLKNLCKENPKSVFYLSTEGKTSALANRFTVMKDPIPPEYDILSDPRNIFNILAAIEQQKEITTVVIDSITFLFNSYKQNIINKETQKFGAWQGVEDFWYTLMNQFILKSSKNYIITSHLDSTDQDDGTKKYNASFIGRTLGTKGGLEALFDYVVYTRHLRVMDAEALFQEQYPKVNSKDFVITDRERGLEHKYCFQTNPTGEYFNSTIRSANNPFRVDQTFIDNDINLYLSIIDKSEEEEN